MTSSLNVKRTFLPPGYKIEYRATIESPEIFLPKLVDSVLREIIEPLVLRCAPIVNMKGRDQRNLISENHPVTLLPTADEFFFVAGSISRPTKGVTKEHDFSVAINSRFIANEESHHMLHVSDVERRYLPETVPIEQLGRLPGLHLKIFRLGLDLFESRFLSSLIGLVPTVSQTLLLEATEKACEISIVAEGLKNRSELPLQLFQIGERISKVVSDSLGMDLKADYSRQLAL